MRLALRRWSVGPRTRTATYRPVPYGRYAAPVWIQRHRWMAYLLLGLFCMIYGYAFAIYGQFLLSQTLMPLTVLVAFVVWLLPVGRRAPSKWIDRLLIAFLAALLAWPDYVALNLPGLPWITAIRLTAIPLLVILLISTSTLPGFRREMAETLSVTPIIWKLLLAFTAVTAATIVLSDDKFNSLNKFLVSQLTWTAIFFASVWTFRKPGKVRLVALVLLGTVAANLVFSLYELRFHRAMWADHLPSFLMNDDPIVQKMMKTFSSGGPRGYRVRSKYTTPLGLAEYLALATPLIIHLGVTAKSWPLKLAAFLALPVMLFMVIETDARLGAIGMFIAVALYSLGWAVLKWRKDRQNPVATLVILAYPTAMALLLAASFTFKRVRKQMWGGGETQSSSAARDEMWRMGIPKVLRNPIGHGPGQGAETLGFRSPLGTLTIDTYYLTLLLEYGILGFTLYFGMFLYAIYRAGETVLRTSDEETAWLVPIGIALCNFVIIKYVFNQQDNHPFVFMMLGMVVALVARGAPAKVAVLNNVTDIRKKC